MLDAVLVAVSTFILTYLGLMFIERLIHKLTKNRDRNYRWGVWTFAILAGVYMFINYLGR